jgi:hypothetical protein
MVPFSALSILIALNVPTGHSSEFFLRIFAANFSELSDVYRIRPAAQPGA